MYILLQRAKNIDRNDAGAPVSWTGTNETIGTFTDGDKFIAYIQENIKDLGNAVAFTGSASMIQQANHIIGQELIKAGLIK